MFKSILLATMLAVVGATATASEFTVDGIKYNVTDSVAKTVEVIANNYQYDITIPETVTPDTTTWTVTAIGEEAFKDCNISIVTLPNTITKIKKSAFYASEIIDINMPNSLDSICESAFGSCKQLSQISLPNSLRFIGNGAFSSSGLTKIVIPEGVIEMGSRAFYNSSIKQATLPSSLAEIPQQCFENCLYLEQVSLSGTKAIKNNAFYNCRNLTEINLPESLSEIGESAFYSSAIKRIVIPSNVRTIDKFTLSECDSLTEVVLPAKLSVIKEFAFQGSSIKHIELPESLTRIESLAFNGCDSLTSMFFSSTMLDMHKWLIGGCYNLKEIHVRTQEPTVIVYSETFHSEIIANCDLFVPKGCVDAYKAANIWNQFRSIQEESLNIAVDDKKVMIVGSESKLMVSTKPVAFPNGCITFSSSDDAIATVNDSGIISAISPGNAIITATASINNETVSSSCAVEVTSAPENYLTAESVACFAQSNHNLVISMENAASITAFQCDVVLPNSISLVTVEEEYDITFAGRETRSHTITSELQADGAIRVAAFSSKNSSFDGNSGALFNIPLVASDKVGEFNILLKNIILVDNNNNEIFSPELNIAVVVSDFITGDANIDNKVTISDATTTVSYILGESPEPFLEPAADVTADGNVTINDVTGIINIVLGASQTATTTSIKSKAIIPFETSENDKIYVDNFEIAAGETKDVEICMANNAAYTAFQCDIYLPEGLSFLVEDGEYIVDLSDRKSRSHTIATSLQPDGALRVVAFSSKNANFADNDGALMIVPVVAGETVGTDLEMSVRNNLFVSNNVEYTFPDITAKVNSLTSIENISAEGETQIYVEGHTLHIISPVSCQMPLYSIDGRCIMLEVSQGDNSYVIAHKGIYIINRQKVVIK